MTLTGKHSVLADMPPVLHVPVMKSGWPITRLAAWPLLKGGEYRSILLLFKSVAQRFPEESNEALPAVFRPVVVVAAVLVVKEDWPITRFAAWPLVKLEEADT